MDLDPLLPLGTKIFGAETLHFDVEAPACVHICNKLYKELICKIYFPKGLKHKKIQGRRRALVVLPYNSLPL